MPAAWSCVMKLKILLQVVKPIHTGSTVQRVINHAAVVDVSGQWLSLIAI